MLFDDTQDEDKSSNQEEATILDPDYSLKEEIGDDISEIIDEKKVIAAKASIEQSIDAQKDEFIKNTKEELVKLKTICGSLAKTEQDNKKNIEAILQIALNIKSNASLYSYTLAEKIATSLYILSKKLDEVDEKTIKILNSYTDALTLVFAQGLTDHENETAKALLVELYKISGTEADA